MARLGVLAATTNDAQLDKLLQSFNFNKLRNALCP
jgi:hypothetical protein